MGLNTVRASYEVPHGTSNTAAAVLAAQLAEETGAPVRVFFRLCTATVDLAEAAPTSAAVRRAAERLNREVARIGDRLMRVRYADTAPRLQSV